MVPKPAFHISGVVAQYPGTVLQGMSWLHGKRALVIPPTLTLPREGGGNVPTVLMLMIPLRYAPPREGGASFSAAAPGNNSALITPALDGRGPGGG
jgi:hypothetical protein